MRGAVDLSLCCHMQPATSAKHFHGWSRWYGTLSTPGWHYCNTVGQPPATSVREVSSKLCFKAGNFLWPQPVSLDQNPRVSTHVFFHSHKIVVVLPWLLHAEVAARSRCIRPRLLIGPTTGWDRSTVITQHSTGGQPTDKHVAHGSDQ